MLKDKRYLVVNTGENGYAAMLGHYNGTIRDSLTEVYFMPYSIVVIVERHYSSGLVSVRAIKELQGEDYNLFMEGIKPPSTEQILEIINDVGSPYLHSSP